MRSNNAYEQSHDKFLQELERSQIAVQRVALALNNKGHTIMLPAVHKAPNRKDWKKYSDSGDLLMWWRGRWQRVEVKRLGVNFTGAHDWPFETNFIVNSVGSHDRAKAKSQHELLMYVVVSDDMRHQALVSGASEKRWRKAKRNDHIVDGKKLYYFAHLNDVKFGRL